MKKSLKLATVAVLLSASFVSSNAYSHVEVADIGDRCHIILLNTGDTVVPSVVLHYSKDGDDMPDDFTSYIKNRVSNNNGVVYSINGNTLKVIGGDKDKNGKYIRPTYKQINIFAYELLNAKTISYEIVGKTYIGKKIIETRSENVTLELNNMRSEFDRVFKCTGAMK